MGTQHLFNYKPFSVTGGTTAIEKGFNQTGRGPASPLLRRAHCVPPLWRHLIQSIQSIVDMHGKQELFSSGSATVLQAHGSNFEMMPQKTHSLVKIHRILRLQAQERTYPGGGVSSASCAHGSDRRRSGSARAAPREELAIGFGGLAADLRIRSGKSSGSASGGGRVSKSGGLAAGTAPNRIGADHNGGAVEEIEAGELYSVFDPVGLHQYKWSLGEVARVVAVLPDLHLPWKKGVPGNAIAALDEAIFDAGVKDSTASLVDADVAATNCAFGGAGDCENALVDYHLWALALLLNTRCKVRPVHLANVFDVTSLCKLRKLGYSQKPPRTATKAADMQWAQVIFFKKVHVAEILSVWGFAEAAKATVGPTSEGRSSATKLERSALRTARRQRIPSGRRSALARTRMNV